MDHSKCAPLFEAGQALLGKCGLVRWNGETGVFEARYPGNNDCNFEKFWKVKFHQEFGRYIAWVLFSVGAENLAKAACVCNGVVHYRGNTLRYPRYMGHIPVTEWVDMVLNDKCSDGSLIRATTHNYQKLDRYWQRNLHTLCKKQEICADETRHLIASYKYLSQAIRNRDAHTYVAGERRRDFPAVEPIFVPAFNTLVETMRKKNHFNS